MGRKKYESGPLERRHKRVTIKNKGKLISEPTQVSNLILVIPCIVSAVNTRWFKYYRDDLCVNKSHFVPVIFEPPCNIQINYVHLCFFVSPTRFDCYS
jgi:hypothetical protein